MRREALQRLAGVVAESGLVPPGSSGVAMLSGGPDSGCLAAGLAGVLDAGDAPLPLVALHLNYGLRDGSDAEEEACRELCETLAIELRVERPRLPPGNLQGAAREARYAAAERLRAERGADWIATGHTRTDLAETVLYRLASSPGRRALLGLPPRRGHLVRPLLSLSRAEARRLAGEAGLPFRDDPSNRDPRFARARLREEVLPVLREINPAAEESIAATWAELAEEGAALDALIEGVLEEAGAGGGVAVVRSEALADLHPALRRLALRDLAERAAGAPVAFGRERAAQVWRLAEQPEGGEIELGGGVAAVCESGYIRFVVRDRGAPPQEREPVALAVPGSCRFGRWSVQADLHPCPVRAAGPDVATLDADSLGERLEVRSWRSGDRMRPLGLEGSKSLQDLFTDRRIPRSMRHELPIVVTEDGAIAWVAGVAVAERFKLSPASRSAAVLTAHLAYTGRR